MDIWKEVARLFGDRPALDELLMNGHEFTFFVEENQIKSGPLVFSSDAHMQQVLQDLAFTQGQRLDPYVPSCGGLIQLPALDLRWHCLLPPLARDGPLLSLRRQRLCTLSHEDFAEPAVWDLLAPLWETRRTTLFIGDTGSGKTSLLIALLRHLYGERRVAVLEQVPEIPKISPLWVRLAAQEIDIQGRGGVALEQVFGELLRLRPDVVAIGELRQAEVKALKRALLAGVGPVWSTLHAHGVRALCARLGELSQDSEIFWEKYLTQQSALVLVMQREKPRLREAWRFSYTGLELIFSSTRGTERQGSF